MRIRGLRLLSPWISWLQPSKMHAAWKCNSIVRKEKKTLILKSFIKYPSYDPPVCCTLCAIINSVCDEQQFKFFPIKNSKSAYWLRLRQYNSLPWSILTCYQGNSGETKTSNQQNGVFSPRTGSVQSRCSWRWSMWKAETRSSSRKRFARLTGSLFADKIQYPVIVFGCKCYSRYSIDAQFIVINRV